MTELSRAGVTVTIPPGWEAELSDYDNRIVLHMSNVPLPPGRSDFGGPAIDRLANGSIFVAVLEYEPSDANRGLFHRTRRPAFVPSNFAPNRLHHSVPGKTGAQKFFTLEGRTFCCYAVIAKATPSVNQVAKVNQLLRGLSMTATRQPHGIQ